MPVRIRHALPDEAFILTEIALAAKRYWGYPENWIKKWTPLLTVTSEDIQNGEIYCALSEKQPVGFYRLLLRGSRAILDDLWIKPAFIGMGYGRALFDHAVDHCRVAHLDILELEADPHAQGFYEKMGMHKVGEHPVNLLEERNLPIMEMQI